jgi:hypothetical protein
LISTAVTPSAESVTQKETNFINREEFVISLAPMSVDFGSAGISQRCEDVFKPFSLLSLLQTILRVCDIETAPKEFVLCLLRLPKDSGAHSKSAKSFLRYLSDQQTRVFLEICKEYLRVMSWFFHEVEVLPQSNFPGCKSLIGCPTHPLASHVGVGAEASAHARRKTRPF